MITEFANLVGSVSDHGLLILLWTLSLFFIFCLDSLSHFFFSLLLYPPQLRPILCYYWLCDVWVGKAARGGQAI